MEKVAGFLGRSHDCQLLAAAARNRALKLEYMELSELWLELALARQELLIDAGIAKPH